MFDKLRISSPSGAVAILIQSKFVVSLINDFIAQNSPFTTLFRLLLILYFELNFEKTINYLVQNLTQNSQLFVVSRFG
jgi:hypothetical protein